MLEPEAEPGLAGLPGAELIGRGLGDLAGGVQSVEACLVACATTRLRGLGLLLAEDVDLPEKPELMLYSKLTQQYEDPYYRYNSLRRLLDSFIAALQARCSRRAQAKAEI